VEQLTDREIKREEWRKAAVKALAQGLDRDKLIGCLLLGCAVNGKTFEERDTTVTVHGGPKYLFLADGQVKSIIRDGRAYGPEGERPYVKPRGAR
jgi:hypothetical protein